jgi:hypothetical protein
MKALSIDELKKMIDTFTISYYLGHNIELVDVNWEENAYTTGNSDIHIGVGVINQALAGLPDDTSDAEVRTLVRSVFYHELGHILLSPVQAMLNAERDLEYYNYFQEELDKVLKEYKEKEGIE